MGDRPEPPPGEWWPVHNASCATSYDLSYKCTCGLDNLKTLEVVASMAFRAAIIRKAEGDAIDLTIPRPVWDRLGEVVNG